MIKVSEIITSKPVNFNSELHKKVYNTLEKLEIPFERVDTDEAITMEDCVEIGRKLDTGTETDRETERETERDREKLKRESF